MKKEYSKPSILIENFSLIENIAEAGHTCTIQTHTYYYSSCYYEHPTMGNIFISDKCELELEIPEDGGLVIDCLNGAGNAFSS